MSITHSSGTKVVLHHLTCQGLFSSVIKDITGSKAKHVPNVEAEVIRESIEELDVVFSNANFPSDAEDRDNLTMDEDEIDIGISKIAFLFPPPPSPFPFEGKQHVFEEVMPALLLYFHFFNSKMIYETANCVVCCF